MVKEYFNKKLEDILEELRIKQWKYDENCNLEHILRKDIYKLQKESDINFEVFYPRSKDVSLKGKINKLSQRSEVVYNENLELLERLKELNEQKEKYQYMLNEIIRLEELCGHSESSRTVKENSKEKDNT